MLVFSIKPIAFALLDAAVNLMEPDEACRRAGLELGRWTAGLREFHEWEGIGMCNGWSGLFQLMQHNRVAAMSATAAKKAGAPRGVLMPWLAEKEKAASWQRHQREVQDEIFGVMARHGIEPLTLKGTHTARHYPEPATREFSDLDLYFYGRHDEADSIAARELGVEVSRDAHHHTKYNYRGITVESHYDFVNTHYPPSNRSYEALLKGLAPSATFEVLFLLRHMACHFAAGRITLRDLADWTLTCRALKEETDWTEVREVAKQYGMCPFAGAIEEICAERLQGERWVGLTADPATTQQVEQDIVYGNAASHDSGKEGIGRLGWKTKRWGANRWKRRMVYAESEAALTLSSITSHMEKPRSILHKM